MKIKSTKSSGRGVSGARGAKKAEAKETFAAALSRLEAQTETAEAGQPAAAQSASRLALQRIGRAADLKTAAGADAAVRDAARYLVSSRLGESYRETPQGLELVESIGEYAASDPLLKSRLLSILKRLDAE
jgi:hypothetical protein